MGTAPSRAGKEETVLYRYLHLSNKIGFGAFGTSFKATDKRNGNLFVVKRTLLQDYGLDSVEKITRASHEVDILKTISSQENIVTFYDVNVTERDLCIILEYCDEGTLNDFVLSRKLCEPKMKEQFFKNIIFGLMHIHEHSIAHTDLKPDNILLSNGVCKISNLGLATFSKTPEDQKRYMSLSPELYGNKGGTRYFWAPEINDHVYMYKRATKPFSCVCDVFSLGLICLVLWATDTTCFVIDQVSDNRRFRAIVPCINDRPFSECLQFQINQTVRQSGAPQEVIDGILKMLCVDEEKRATSEHVMVLIKPKTVKWWKKLLLLIRAKNAWVEFAKDAHK